MNLYTAILLSSFLLSLFLASFVYNLNKKNSINKQFAVFCLTMACFSYLVFELQTSTNIDTAHFWNQLTSFFPFTAITLLHFLLIFTEKKTLLSRRGAYIFMYGMGTLVTILYLLKDTILTKKEWWWSSEVTDSTAWLGTVTNIWASLMGFVLLAIAAVYYIKTKEPRKRKQALFMVYALSLIIVFGLVSEIILPNFFSIASPPLTASAFTLSSLIIAYAVWKFRLFSLDPGIVAENVIATMPDGLILADNNGIIIRSNNAAEKLFQYNKNELAGKNYMILFSNPAGNDTPLSWNNRLNIERIISDVEVQAVTKNKKEITMALSATIIVDEKMKLAGTVFVFRDLTNHKQAEKWLRATLAELAYKTADLEKTNKDLSTTTGRLIQAEKLTILGELISSIIHELNQPLNLTKIICQSIIKDIRNNRYDAQCAQNELPEILTQIDKMAEIVDHMRIFSRTTGGEPHHMIDINEIIENSFKFMGQELKDNEINIHRELTRPLPLIEGDPIRIEQLLLNLITNARKALETCTQPDKILGIYTRKHDDGTLIIEVTDNGCGIPGEIHEKIFEPFFTTGDTVKRPGLGLSVVKKIADEHGGRIKVESSVGKGSVFRVILPTTQKIRQVVE